jgi:hypothetical protein
MVPRLMKQKQTESVHYIRVKQANADIDKHVKK